MGITTIHEILRQRAESAPGAPAICSPGHAVCTFGEVWQHAREVKDRLNERGIGRNQPVALVLPNGPAMATAFLGVASCATSAPLNPGYRKQEFDFYLSDLGVKAVIVDRTLDSPVRDVAGEHAIPVIELDQLPQETAGSFTLDGGNTETCPQPGFAGPHDIALILHTSGTTSRPKMVPLSHANLCASANHIMKVLELTPDDRCLNVMPLFHIHGLIAAVLSSLAAGASVVCTPGFLAPKFFEWFRDVEPTWYTAVPTMQQAILSRAESHRDIIKAGRLRFIRSSSSALPPRVILQLEETFGVPVIESYGMTEASHQMTSNPLPPKIRKNGSVGTQAGPEVAIMNDAGQLLEPGETGEIVIRGPNVTQGYANNPEANTTAYTNGWFRTGDQGYFDMKGYLFISGRIKEIINRGGEKISPREVDDVLMDHPDVQQAVTFAVSHPELNEELAAAVILKEKAMVTEQALQEFALNRMADFKVPRKILFLNEIPKGPTGKLQRIGLAEKLGVTIVDPPGSSGFAAYVAPGNATETKCDEIWREVLCLERIGVHNAFFQIGGDSVLAAQVLARVRDAFHCDLSFAVFFNAPTIAGMAEAVEQARREDTLLPIQRVTRDKPLTPSFTQQRMWFLDQLDPGNPMYNRPAFIRIKGTLEISTLHQTLNKIINRHESLRAIFPSEQGHPELCTLQSVDLDLTLLDVSGNQPAVKTIVEEEAQRVFNLAEGPLVRSRLLKLGDNEHLLILSFHHIVFDGWSMGVLMHELTMLYDAFFTHAPSPLPELPIQYPDYADWQRSIMESDAMRRQIAFWREELQGCPTFLENPTDFPRPAIRTSNGAEIAFEIDPATSERLKTYSRESNTTLFMSLLAVFQVLLYHHTGQRSFLIGSPIAGRSRTELEPLIGVMINTILMRTDIQADLTFRDVLDHVRSRSIRAFSNQDVPFEKLVEELKPRRDLSRSPMFQVLFQLRNLPGQNAQSSVLTFEEVQFDTGISKVDLGLDITEIGEALACCLEYNTDLYKEETIWRLAEQYVGLVQDILEHPDGAINKLPMMSKQEQEPVSAISTPTIPQVVDEHCVHSLVERHVADQPHHTAVEMGASAITYGELDRKANQLAHVLLNRGIGLEQAVGLCMERSVEQIVAVLGILKAGGAFIPLDPTYPEDRLAFMLQDASIDLCIADTRSVAKVQAVAKDGSGTHILEFEKNGKLLEDKPEHAPNSSISPQNLAYIMYTSGTTGQPKGVMVEHHSLANYTRFYERYMDAKTDDRFLQLSNFTFDGSLEEIFGALVSGASLVLAPHDILDSVPHFFEFVDTNKISMLNMPTAVWHTLMAGMEHDVSLEFPAGVRSLVIGGEKAFAHHFKVWQARIGDRIRLFNSYGPTETTVVSVVYELTEAAAIQMLLEDIPIGFPISNTQVYVLDEDLQPVTRGVPGELCVGGHGVARGYLNRPELTAGRFLPDTLSSEAGARYYRTGDRVRLLPDGALQFLGRLDQQLKVRGFRVEPGEIEHHLLNHPSVQDAIVSTPGGTPSSQESVTQLMAFLVTRRPPPPQEEILAYLRGKLPAYMMPSALVFIEQMPRLPNGKVDHSALARESSRAFDRCQTMMPPSTPIEMKLHVLWMEVLGQNRFGIHDDFFDLGGHSLLATQLMSRIRNAFGCEIPLRRLFESPTIAGLAEFMRQEANLDNILSDLESLSPSEARDLLDELRSSRQGHSH